MTSITLRSLWAHALAWAAFITYEVSIIFFTSTPQRAHWWEYIGFYGANMLLFYVNAHLLLSYTLHLKKLRFLLLVLLPFELLLYIALQYGIDLGYNLIRDLPRPIQLNEKYVLSYLWRGIYFICLSTTYWLVRRALQHNKLVHELRYSQLQAQQEKAELEKSLVQAQNAYLQAQINPHLLFNTLNFIYNKVQDVSLEASRGVLLLSEVMHHALTGVHADGKTDLRQEIEHIKKYVALHQLRFSYPLQLHLQLENDFKAGHRIPPLVLLPFVENVFHHGDLTDPSQPARVRVHHKGNTLHFETENKKRAMPARLGHGIGVQNVKTRLTRFYTEQGFSLVMEEKDTTYSVHLKLDLA